MKSSTPRLSESARHVVAPEGITATGWPAVRDKCRDLGISFRPWQHGAGRLILAKRADGKYAATIGGTGLSIPRQVGKTYLIAAIVFALCLLRPGLTVIWTAHRLRTAEETFGKMQVFAKRRRIAPHVLKVILGSGEEEIRFVNGSRIMFGARERGFGRGFDEVDVLIYDEAQILGESALDDMVPATNQSRQDTGALLLFLGTPPKPTDNGEVFKRMRVEALSGEDRDTGWVEFGADPGFVPTPLPAPLSKADWEQIAKANPSYPQDTPREAILRMRKKLGPDSFLREGLGIWDEDALEPIPRSLWKSLADLRVNPDRPVGPVSFALHTRYDRSATAIAVCGIRADTTVLVQVVDSRPGVGWAVGRVKQLVEQYPTICGVVVDPKSAVSSVIPELEEAGVELVKMTAMDVAQAFGIFHDAAHTRSMRHLDQSELNDALAGAKTRVIGEARTWDGRGEVDIKDLVAATNALWGWTTRHGSGELQIF